MDFNDTSKEAEFRQRVRAFLDQNAEKRVNLKQAEVSSAGAPETVQGGSEAVSYTHLRAHET